MSRRFVENLVILGQTVLEIYDCLNFATNDDDTGLRRSSRKGKKPFGVLPKTYSVTGSEAAAVLALTLFAADRKWVMMSFPVIMRTPPGATVL